jgi:hypothetical protein
VRSCLRRNVDQTAENVVNKILALMIGLRPMSVTDVQGLLDILYRPDQK